jgi:transposase
VLIVSKKGAMMKPKRNTKGEAYNLVRDIKRATPRKFSAEEKIRIVLAGLRGEDSIAESSRRKGLHQNLDYRWSKEFLEARKKR